PYINLPLYTVYNVTDNSPAHNAGIRAGDQVKAINYMSAANLNLDDINSILHGHESTIIRLKIIRDEEEIRVKFALVDDI
ncbi:MAG: PDZ domain-containing protein, partial [Bacteroidetes bacterium]|nr:PDZ domain-containing protein [Bacteroidota bacterium]